jgi:hypothetical protein
MPQRRGPGLLGTGLDGSEHEAPEGRQRVHRPNKGESARGFVRLRLRAGPGARLSYPPGGRDRWRVSQKTLRLKNFGRSLFRDVVSTALTFPSWQASSPVLRSARVRFGNPGDGLKFLSLLG